MRIQRQRRTKTWATALACLLPLVGSASWSTGQETDPGAEAVAELLEPYIGHWVNERRETPEGRGFRYTYRLEWFDSTRRIAELTIERHWEDGEEVTSWKGYKGWDQVDERIYYYGFSPSGRWSRGSVRRQDSTVVTEYDGYAPEGEPVQIKDVFFPVVDRDRFLAVTYMRRDGGWGEILRDQWRRVPEDRTDDDETGETHSDLSVPTPVRRLSPVVELRLDGGCAVAAEPPGRLN